MHRLYFIFLLLCVSLPTTLLAQTNTTDNNLQTVVAKGDSCLSQFNYAHAVAYFKTANDLLPSNLLRRKMASCYSHLGLYRDCIAMLREIQGDKIGRASCRERV